MRYTMTLILAAAAVFNTACTSVLSLEGAPAAVSPEPGLAGVWMPKDDDDVLVVRMMQDGSMDIRYDGLRLVGRAFRAGGGSYVTITPHKEEPLQVRAHAVVQYWLQGDSLRWTFMDSKWLRARLTESGVPARQMRDGLVLTGGFETVYKALAEYGTDRRSYDDVCEMKRLERGAE